MDNQISSTKSKFLQKFDFFSVKYGFRINEDKAFKSNFGGIIFILYLVFILIYFSFSFNYFWNGKNYSINYSVTKSNETEIDLKNTNFSVGFKNNFPFIQDYLHFEVYYHFDNNSIKINERNCTLNDFPIGNKTFNKMKLSNYKCLDLINLSISGEMISNESKNLSIQIHIMSNNTSEWKKIQDKFTKQNILYNPFELIWLDKSVDVENMGNSIENIFMIHKMFLYKNKTSKLNMYISKMEFSSDNNIFYPEKITKNLSFVDRIYTNTHNSFELFNNEPKQNLVEINFFFSQKNVKLERIYKKLSEFLAEFGSINSNLLLLLTIFVTFINEFWAEQKLMNKLLRFREHMKLNNPKEINLMKTNFQKNTFDNNDSFDSNNFISQNKGKTFQVFKEEVDIFPHQKKEKPIQFSLEMTEKQEKITPIQINIETEQRAITLPRIKTLNDDKLKELEIILVKMKKPIVFSCYDVILRQCCCKSTNLELKNELYQKALKKTNNYMDIITYIKKMQEVEILKYLVLDVDQVKIFNFLRMPSISMKFQDSDDYYMNVLNSQVNNVKLDGGEIQELIKSYNSIKRKEDGLNHRLLKLFANEVDHMIIDC